MKKITTALFLSLVLNTSSNAQSKNDSLAGWELTYSPSALLNTYMGFQMGLGRNFKNNIGLEFEVARIPKQTHLRGPEGYKEGYRYKLGFRYRTRGELIFLTTAYLRNTSDNNIEEFLINGQFFQEITYEKTKKITGLTIGFAYCQNIGIPNLSVEWGLSLGSGGYKVRNYGIPENAELLDSRVRFFDDGDYLYPIFDLIIKVRYKLGNRKNASV